MRTIKVLMLAGILGAALVASGQADDEPSPVGAAKASTGVKELSDFELRDMFERMGYETTVTESADKKTKWINVKVTRSELGGTFEVSVALSPNKRKLWAHVHLATLKPEHEANAAALLKLLEQNAAIGPNHFRVDPKTKALYLSRCGDNRGLTPALVKDHLELLLDTCVQTKGDWNTDKWDTIGGTAKK
jgi:hypothetical protein